MFAKIRQCLQRYSRRRLGSRRQWARRTLVVGPSSLVDGDSVACTRALIDHLRALGLEAFTLPTLAMFPQIEWVLKPHHFHPACHPFTSPAQTTSDLQACYDAVSRVWQPDEIIEVDGQLDRLGFQAPDVPKRVIDHHVDRGARDDEDAFIQKASSTGCLLVRQFAIYDPILVVAILTDTYWLRQNMPSEAIESLALLRKHGKLTDEVLIDIQRQLRVPGDPCVLDAIRKCRMQRRGEAVFAVLDTDSPEIHRGVCGELGYFYKHLCVVRGDGYVSFRTTNQSIDLSKLAQRWHGGGHPNMSAGNLPDVEPSTLERLREEFLAAVQVPRAGVRVS